MVYKVTYEPNNPTHLLRKKQNDILLSSNEAPKTAIRVTCANVSKSSAYSGPVLDPLWDDLWGKASGTHCRQSVTVVAKAEDLPEGCIEFSVNGKGSCWIVIWPRGSVFCKWTRLRAAFFLQPSCIIQSSQLTVEPDTQCTEKDSCNIT